MEGILELLSASDSDDDDVLNAPETKKDDKLGSITVHWATG